MHKSAKKTPLLVLLRALSPEERTTLAGWAGTSVSYLYQLAGCARSSPRVRLVLDIEKASIRMNKRTRGRTPVVTAVQMAAMSQP